MSDNILVSILCPTFNHSSYIRDALDGFINQNCNFGFEIIINDDASTDGTTDILREYQMRYPDVFRLNIQRQNQYQQGVRGPITRILLPMANGKYVALCDGDDYWTDPDKLARQVAYMEANPDCTLCFHPVQVINEVEKTKSIFPASEIEFTLGNLIKANFLQTNSAMYRRMSDFVPTAKQIMPMDWYLHLCHAANGKIGYINKTMAVYRIHSEGIWTALRKSDSMQFMLDHALPKLRFHLVVREMFANRGYADECDTAVLTALQQIVAVVDRDSLEDFLMLLLDSGNARYEYSDLLAPLLTALIKSIDGIDAKHQKVIDEIFASTSWKITKPIRLLGSLFK
ncbi:MAG: glycosyltransferase [Coriobacteriales bacterium]|jgi:glycosyltransferase involved in cell wall biosynthesis|nr:glycosyltransferase [Coriobacteriales bacterium]